MLRVPYQYIESEVAPYLSLISKALGIGYSFIGLFGVACILRLGELYMGLGCIVGAVVLFFISRLYNSSVEKKIRTILENHPEKAIEIGYNRELNNLRADFDNRKISKDEYIREKELLDREMVVEMRQYLPNYKLGDKV